MTTESYEKELREFTHAIVEMRTILKNVDEKIDDLKCRTKSIEGKAEDAKVAIARLEVKNGLIASALGVVSGFFGAVLKIKT